jgi:hypothetical protein
MRSLHRRRGRLTYRWPLTSRITGSYSPKDYYTVPHFSREVV